MLRASKFGPVVEGWPEKLGPRRAAHVDPALAAVVDAVPADLDVFAAALGLNAVALEVLEHVAREQAAMAPHVVDRAARSAAAAAREPAVEHE